MGGLFQFYLNKGKKAYADFSNTAYWLEKLCDEEPEAIHYLYNRIMSPVMKLAKRNQLNEEWAEELINDCIVLFISKIKEGHFVYQNIDPIHYVMELARKNLNNYKRKSIKYSTNELDDQFETSDTDIIDLEDVCRQLNMLLKKLDPNCERLIRLKYIDELKDSEIIEKAYTQYTTINALKNKRAQCFKKLVELAQLEQHSLK